jgi:pilus assembly protein CpaF
VNLPMRAIRAQITSAVDIIIQTERMRDGVRRVTEVAEVAGAEEDIISLGGLFAYRYLGENADGSLRGVFERRGGRPRFMSRIEYYGLGAAFKEAIGSGAEEAAT